MHTDVYKLKVSFFLKYSYNSQRDVNNAVNQSIKLKTSLNILNQRLGKEKQYINNELAYMKIPNKNLFDMLDST